MMASEAKCQEHVRLCDRAGRRAQHADADLFGRDLGDRLLERFERALHVGLDQHRQLLDAALGDLT